MKNNKIKSFDQYVENRIIETTDFEKLAYLINAKFEENGGYITESDLAEAWFGVPSIARAASGVVGAMGGIGADIGKAAGRGAQAVGSAVGRGAQAVGSAIGQAGQAVGRGAQAVGGAVGRGAQAVGGAVGQAGQAVGRGAQAVGGAVGQAGQATGQYFSNKYQTAVMQQAASQIQDRIVDIQKNPLFTNLEPNKQQQVMNALQMMIQQ